MLASCRIDEGHEVSSTDFDVAYLQSRPWLNKLVLIVYKNPFTGEDVYEWLSGVIYGMQTGAFDWKDTLAAVLTTDLGFYELHNMQSMYHHPQRKTDVACHVDDPLTVSRSTADKEWFYSEIAKVFDTKGDKTLSPELPLDYLSMRISMNEAGDIRLDNEVKIKAYLKEKGMELCNPAKQPLQKDTLKTLYENKAAGKLQSREDLETTGKWMGEAQWLSQTTHPIILPALSPAAAFSVTPCAVSFFFASWFSMRFRV